MTRDPRTDPRPGDCRLDADGRAALHVLAVGDDVHAVYLRSGVEASWPLELWRTRMSGTFREDWKYGYTPDKVPAVPDAALYAAYVLGVVVLGVVAGLYALAVGS